MNGEGEKVIGEEVREKGVGPQKEEVVGEERQPEKKKRKKITFFFLS